MNRDRLVFWALLIVVVGAWTATAIGLLGPGVGPIVIAIVVTLAASLVGAWQLDRGRRIQTSQHYDENAANFSAPANNQTWQVPTAYIDHRSGGGTPPGINDLASVDDVEGDREGRRPRDTGDPAP
jgi:hypothetical protein